MTAYDANMNFFLCDYLCLYYSFLKQEVLFFPVVLYLSYVSLFTKTSLLYFLEIITHKIQWTVE